MDTNSYLTNVTADPCQRVNTLCGGRQRTTKLVWRAVAAVLLASLLHCLTACGGGGNSGPPDASQTPVDEPDTVDNVFANDRKTSGCTLISE